MIPWDLLIADGVVTDRQAKELWGVIVKHESGVWSFNGFCDLTDDQREACERVVLAVCTPGRMQ